MAYSSDYEVILDGGDNVAVVPLGSDIDPIKDYAWLYNKPSGAWGGKQRIQSILAHGNYWTAPVERAILRIPGPPPKGPSQ